MSYYTQNTNAVEHTRARAAFLNSEFARVQAAFAQIPDFDFLRSAAFVWGEELPSSTATEYRVRTSYPARLQVAGAAVRFVVRTTSTGTATLSVDGRAAKSLVQRDGRPVAASTLRAGTAIDCIFDGDSWRVVSGVEYDAPAHVFQSWPQDRNVTVDVALDAFVLPELVGTPGGAVYSCAGLPQGLAFSAGTRTVTGTPTVTGDVKVTYTATVGADSFEAAFSINVRSSTLVVDSQRDLTLVQGVQYSGVALVRAVSGSGTPPYAYVLTVGQLPLGMRFDPTSVTLLGTPSESGTFRDVLLRVRDSGGQSVDITFDITVSSTLPLELPSVSVISTQQGTAVNTQLPAATGGLLPYTYEARQLSGGLAFDPATRRLTGTPAQPGTYVFEYRATDSAGTVETEQVTVSVMSPGSRITAVVDSDATVDAAVLAAGRSFGISATSLALPVWVGQKKLVVAQPDTLPDLTRIVIGGLGNSISAFSKGAATVSSGGVDYAVWVSNEAQGDAISGDALEVG